MFSWLRYIPRRLLINLVGVTLLAVAIWFFGGLIVLFGWQPLANPYLRALVALLPFVALGLHEGLRALRIRRLNRRMMASLLETEGLPAEIEPADHEQDLLAERFEDAMEVLREHAVGGRSGNRYIYELPWYIIIGPPGAGKTTILRNSGLDFPLVDHLGAESVQGFGGTRNCDWWFTNEAVLIDTAGRYTLQDSATAGRAAWRTFLDLLKRHRRRCPINGVLLTISLADVLLDSEAQRQAHVKALRDRLQELMRAFRMRIPVYVLITKCDLIPGFSAFFDDLDEEGREQPFGITFDPDVSRQPSTATRRFYAEYDGLVGRVAQQLGRRLHEERSLEQRRAIFGFTQELAELKPIVGSFVADVFRETRYELPAWPRGVYFTSGTQQGTPIDRLLGSLSSSFGLSQRQLPAFSGRGKAFFIHNVLTDVVFREANLAGGDRRYERLRLAGQTGAAAVCAGLVIVLGLIWYTAYGVDAARITELHAAIDRYRAIAADLPPNPSLSERIAVLEAADAIPDVFDSSWVPALLAQAGIAAKSALYPEAVSARDAILRQRYWYDVRDILEAQLAEGLAVDAGDGFIRESLRYYLMLTLPSRFEASNLRSWLRTELRRVFPLDPDKQTLLMDFYDRVVALGPPDIALDDGLIARARAALVEVPLATQVYLSLKSRAATAGIPNFTPSALLRSGGREVLSSRGQYGLFESIPGLYTADGFYTFFIPNLPDAARGEFRGDWVLGDRASQATQDQIADIARQVADLYVADYIGYWDAIIRDVRLVEFQSIQDAMRSLQVLSNPQSPLRLFLEEVRRNTELPQGEAAARASAGTNQPQPQNAVAGAADAAEAALANLSGRAGRASALDVLSGNWPGNAIGRHFRGLNEMTEARDGNQPALTQVQDLLGRVYAQLNQVVSAPDVRRAAYDMAATRVKTGGGDALSDLSARAIRTPNPVQQILLDVSQMSWSLVMDEARRYVDDAYLQEVLPVCQTTVFRRYPMYRESAVDISLNDFSAVFGRDGTFQTFFDTYLVPFVNEGRRGWTNVGLDGISLNLSPVALEQLQRAHGIQRYFFASSGGAPVLAFDLRPEFLDPQAKGANLRIGDKRLDYRHEPPRSIPFVWPPDSGEELVSLAMTDLADNRTTVTEQGPWAFLRFLDRLEVRGGRRTDAFDVSALLNGLTVRYKMIMDSTLNAVTYSEVSQFRCPTEL